MSTRCYIGIQNPDGTVDSVYCHADGYPGWVGRILKDHYASEKRARELILMGGISTLDRSIGQKHDFYVRPEGMCTFYHRDRNDILEIAKGEDWQNYLHASDIHIEWRYLWTKEGWMGCSSGGLVMPIDKLIESNSDR